MFHFLYEIEARFNILKSKFSIQNHNGFNFNDDDSFHSNYFKQFTVHRSNLLEQGTLIYKELLENPNLSGREKFSIVFIDENGYQEMGVD